MLPPEPDIEVWPENWMAKEVAVRMGSQMNVGMGGVTGLRYEALPLVLDVLQVPPADRLDVFDAMRVIEGEIVRLINERR